MSQFKKSDSQDGAAAGLRRRHGPAVLRPARVGVGWNVRSHTPPGRKHTCMRTHAPSARTPQMSWLLPRCESARAELFDGEVWCEVFRGARIEMQGRCTVTLGFQHILMPRLAPDPSNNSRPDIASTAG